MKRRDFIKTSLFAVAATSLLGKAMGLMNKAVAAVVWVAKGKLGYVEEAGAAQKTAGKNCKNCSWYKADKAGGEGAGQCTLKAMQGAMKAPAVYVKDAGYCNMWKKIG